MVHQLCRTHLEKVRRNVNFSVTYRRQNNSCYASSFLYTSPAKNRNNQLYPALFLFILQAGGSDFADGIDNNLWPLARNQ